MFATQQGRHGFKANNGKTFSLFKIDLIIIHNRQKQKKRAVAVISSNEYYPVDLLDLLLLNDKSSVYIVE